jgi:DNA-3-methyladenine glycosylase
MATGTFRTRRVYDEPAPDDGYRVLVDRLWPRGVSRERARLDEWAKDIAPSDELRRWYGHDPEKFDEFARRYRDELDAQPDVVEHAQAWGREHAVVTLLFGARDPETANAAVLQAYLQDGRADAG